MIRVAALVVACALAGMLPTQAEPTGPPYVIHAILSTTGAGAFIGQADAVTLRAAEGVINKSGGIRGRPVHFAVDDDQTNPALAVQLVSTLLAQHASVMLGPSGSATCSAVLPIVAKDGPVAWCLSPSLHPAPGSFSFMTSIAVRDSLRSSLRYFRTRGWHRIALLSSTDATGQDGEQSLHEDLRLPENRDLTLVANEHFNQSDFSVSAQLARIQARGPDALIAWTSGSPFGLILKQLTQSGFEIPVLSTSGNASTIQMEQYSTIVPKELYFSSFVALGADVLRPGPILTAVKQFNGALKTQGVVPDNTYIFAWDPALLLVEVLRRIGPDASAAEVRDELERLHSIAGINGIYDFRDGSQRGIGINAALLVRWDPSHKRWVAVTGPAGRKL